MSDEEKSSHAKLCYKHLADEWPYEFWCGRNLLREDFVTHANLLGLCSIDFIIFYFPSQEESVIMFKSEHHLETMLNALCNVDFD